MRVSGTHRGALDQTELLRVAMIILNCRGKVRPLDPFQLSDDIYERRLKGTQRHCSA